MSENAEKPIWLRPPVDILFNLSKLKHTRPWDVNVAPLLRLLLSEIRRRGYVDFVASGIALLTSSVIYRMQAESLFRSYAEEKRVFQRASEEKPITPPPIRLPFRKQPLVASIDELISALAEVLRAEEELAQSRASKPVLPEPVEAVPPPDEFFVYLEDRMEELLQKIKLMLGGKGIIAFSKLVEASSRKELARIFLLLLFLATRGDVALWQEREYGEVYVVVGAGEQLNG